ncbi:MAG: DUF1194 domain-containing protein [Reyranellaceae bacterium]
MRQMLLRLLVAVAVLGIALPASAQQAVDTALVLAVDASGSIDGEEFAFQKEGIAAAVTDPRVLDAMRSGPHGRIALAYVEWGGPGTARTVVSWQVVSDAASAETFAASVIAAPRSAQSYNAIGDAIDHGVELLQACPCKPTRRVIDISGDNADMRSFRPAPEARNAAVRQRITINALAVLAGSGHPDLVGYYEANVIGGQGAFVLPAQDRRDFARALREKMILEVAWDRPARDAQAASTAD